MIEFIKGRVSGIGIDSFVLDLGSMGFDIVCSQKTLCVLKEGNEITIYTHLISKDDGMQVFGFVSKDERHMFRLLISVNGVGPKAAVSILSAFSPDELAMSIIREDTDALTNVKGIGKKNAGRVVLELKDKIKKITGGLDMAADDIGGRDAGGSEVSEAFSALAVLGYSEKDIKKAVSGIYEEGMTVEQILREALKKM